jgi:malonyl-CoA O-methyltransferase
MSDLSDPTAPQAAEADLAPRAAYALWAATYLSSGRNPLTMLAEATFRTLLPPMTGARVLDVGCGDGRYGRLALQAGAGWAVGLDFSAEMLAAGRVAGGLPLVAGDMAALPFGNASCDVVSHVLALGHLPDPRPALSEAARVLLPGGCLVLVDLHPAAAERDWRRTFRDANGRRHAVQWHPHPLPVLAEGLVAAGLTVEVLLEPALDPADLPDPPPPRALGGPALYGLRARPSARGESA